MGSPTPYDIQSYLLDRANIHDTVTRLAWCYDTGSLSSLRDDVFAPEVTIDYGPLLGTGPFKVEGPNWAQQVGEVLSIFDSTQHLYASILAELPQPGGSIPHPDKCKVFTQGQGHLVRKDARGGPMMQNGAQATFELVRLPNLEALGKNPWRISSQKVVVAWEKGNLTVMEKPKPTEGT